MNNKSAIARIFSGLFQMLYLGWVSFLLVFICGCATIAAKRDTSLGTRVFLAPYEDVWNNLLDVISKNGDTATVKNKTKGVILTGYDRITMERLKEIGKMPPLNI